MLLLIENADVYDPHPIGRASVLVCDGRVLRIGEVDRAAIDKLGIRCEQIDASGCILTPGLIDVHEHLLGGSGEEGWQSETPEITFQEVALAGITTVVG